MKYFLTISLLLSLVGCAHSPIKAEKPFVEPQYGMTKLQLVALLGDPQTIEIYKKPDESRLEFYIYVRKYPSSEEKVPICLSNNKVIGWGKTFHDDHVSMDDLRIK